MNLHVDKILAKKGREINITEKLEVRLTSSSTIYLNVPERSFRRPEKRAKKCYNTSYTQYDTYI